MFYKREEQDITPSMGFNRARVTLALTSIRFGRKNLPGQIESVDDRDGMPVLYVPCVRFRRYPDRGGNAVTGCSP